MNTKTSIRADRGFKLGTTSFIFPDHILPNVKKLGLFFDEIELLVFESQPRTVLPSTAEVKELVSLSQRFDLTYNIHFPVDVSLTCESAEKRQNASDTFLRVMDLFFPLTPTTYTLHLEMPEDIKKDMGNQKKQKKWKDNTRQGLEIFLSNGIDPEIISIETLEYPFSFIAPLVEELNLSICIDAGHQIKYGYNLLETFENHKSRTSIIHLHGVDFSENKIKDHTSLDRLPKEYFGHVQTILKNFTGVVSLEVFNLENLNRSLGLLSKQFKNIVPNIAETLSNPKV